MQCKESPVPSVLPPVVPSPHLLPPSILSTIVWKRITLFLNSLWKWRWSYLCLHQANKRCTNWKIILNKQNIVIQIRLRLVLVYIYFFSFRYLQLMHRLSKYTYKLRDSKDLQSRYPSVCICLVCNSISLVSPEPLMPSLFSKHHQHPDSLL